MEVGWIGGDGEVEGFVEVKFGDTWVVWRDGE